MYSRNFNISYLYQDNSIKSNDISDLNNFDYLSDYKIRNLKQSIMKLKIAKKKYPNNVLLVLISGLDVNKLKDNSEYIEFINYLTIKEKSARVYNLTSQALPGRNVPNWVSFFTGIKIEMSGLNGNIFKQPHVNKFDSIFKRMKQNKISNSIIASPSLELFLKYSLPDANLNDLNSGDLNLLNKLEAMNSLRYSDEKRFQDILKLIKQNKENYKSRANKQNLDGTAVQIEDFYINSFIMIQFSKDKLI